MMLLLYNVLLKVDGNAADGFLLNALKLSIVPLEDDAQEKKKKKVTIVTLKISLTVLSLTA